ERRDLDDGAAQRAILALSTRPSADRAGREPIGYRDLGVEQLGAVYETLLDYVPIIRLKPDPTTGTPSRLKPEITSGRGVRLQPDQASQRPLVALISGSGVRKATGTFYTPQPIAEYLVRRVLGSLVHEATPDRILQLRIVDPAMGSGAFLVAACRYLASAYEAALIQTGACQPTDLHDQDRAAIRRSIAERCLYGVDLNPMAVQLARLSLWLTTLAADRPLSFLDHRLAVGDSLIGAWVASLGRPPTRSGRGPASLDPHLPLFDEPRFHDALRTAVPVRFSLESMPNDTLEEVRAKERALDAMNSRDRALGRWKRIADLWCASWFQTSEHAVPAAAFGALSDFILTDGGPLPTHKTDAYLRTSERIAEARRFFHWEIEFPEVFFALDGTRLANGGFDAVIGNPPWDMIRADRGSESLRGRAREDVALTVRFTRDAGMYRAQSDGHSNRYQLFVERACSLTRAGGRVGLVLPWGLAADRGSAPLRQLLLTRADVDTLVGFDNRRGIFPIHRGVRFLLMTASTGQSTREIACRFGLDDPADLESVGEEPPASSAWFSTRLTPAVLDRVSGPDLTIPWVQTPMDLSIAERAAALFPALGSQSGWSARFGRELNATEDRGSFCGPREGLPIVEGKQIQPFVVDLDAARYAIRRRVARQLLPHGRYTTPRLAYRDVAGATNRLTLIAAILPGQCVSTHTLFCLRTPLALRDQHFLCGLFNSLVVNFLVRLQVTLHVTTAAVERLPIPTREAAPGAVREVASLARMMARSHGDSSAFAFARLQARVADLYQLTTDEFAHVLSTFPLIPQPKRDAAFRLFATETQRTQR
ncbi:MAG: N-6 DNA methylase, partial [Vicinamibacterales bacterium]